jgi:D-alanyl-D-alanine carboxypeptidase
MTLTIRWRGLTAVAASLMLLVGCAHAPAPTPSGAPPAAKGIDAGVARRLDAAVTDAMNANGVPGAIVGLWGPDGQYVKAFGVADRASGESMNVDMFHRIGSLTKTFTVTAVLQLVDQGKLGLDDPIAKYVDGVPRGSDITLRELARMQSGLHNYSEVPAFQKLLYSDPWHPFTPRELVDYAFGVPSDFAPGQGFEYSNTNTVLLGMTVEKISGQPLGDFIRDHILIPLKLSHTSFPDGNAFPTPHAQGYSQNSQNQEVVTSNWDPTWAWAAGAMISTLDDMRLWAQELATGTLLSPATQKQRLETVNDPPLPPQDGYGLGIFDLAGWIGHNGSLPGYQTVVVRLPEQQQTLVVMSNTDIPSNGGEPSTALANAITKIVSPDNVYTLSPDVQAPPAAKPR